MHAAPAPAHVVYNKILRSYWYLHQNLSWRMVDKEKSHKYRVLEHFDDKSLTESLSWLLYSSKFVFLSKHPFCTWSSISWCQSAISSYCVLLSIVILYCADWHQIKYWNAINTWTVQGGNEWTRMSEKDFLVNIHLLLHIKLINKIACFKVKLRWTRGSFFVFPH